MVSLTTLVHTISKVRQTSCPLFLVTLLLTSQCVGVTATTSEDDCCPCGEVPSVAAGLLAGVATYFGGPLLSNWLGAKDEGIQKGSHAAKLMQASSLSGLGGQAVSQMQKMGTASGARKSAATVAGAAYMAAKNRCCPCSSANGDL